MPQSFMSLLLELVELVELLVGNSLHWATMFPGRLLVAFVQLSVEI